MRLSDLVTIVAVIGLIAFIVFAFRQGTKVRTKGSGGGSWIPGGGDGSSGWGHDRGHDGGGHGGDSGGGH
jgi:hypothetical protein